MSSTTQSIYLGYARDKTVTHVLSLLYYIFLLYVYRLDSLLKTISPPLDELKVVLTKNGNIIH